MMKTTLAEQQKGDSALQETVTYEITPIETALVMGDLSRLTNEERFSYYINLCRSLGLNYLSRPFNYLELGSGNERKLVLYATRDCSDQLRKIHRVSTTDVTQWEEGGLLFSKGMFHLPGGRSEPNLSVIPLMKEDGMWKTGANNKRYLEKNGKLVPLSLDEKSIAYMKAMTKLLRRGALAICGLGYADESEVADMQDAVPVDFNDKHEIVPAKEMQQLSEGQTESVPEPQKKVVDETERARAVDYTLSIIDTVKRLHGDLPEEFQSGIAGKDYDEILRYGRALRQWASEKPVSEEFYLALCEVADGHNWSQPALIALAEHSKLASPGAVNIMIYDKFIETLKSPQAHADFHKEPAGV